MSKIEQRYKVVHVQLSGEGSLVLLCVEPLEKLIPPMGAIGESIHQGDEERVVRRTMKTVMKVLPFPMQQRRTLIQIPMKLADYEKLGKPGILDEITLILKKEAV